MKKKVTNRNVRNLLIVAIVFNILTAIYFLSQFSQELNNTQKINELTGQITNQECELEEISPSIATQMMVDDGICKEKYGEGFYHIQIWQNAQASDWCSKYTIYQISSVLRIY